MSRTVWPGLPFPLAQGRFDAFQGGSLPPGTKSLALPVRPKRTASSAPTGRPMRSRKG